MKQITLTNEQIENIAEAYALGSYNNFIDVQDGNRTIRITFETNARMHGSYVSIGEANYTDTNEVVRFTNERVLQTEMASFAESL